MTNRQLKEIAKSKGMTVKNMKQENIIRLIQRAEGNVDCFGTARAEECCQYNCAWYPHCQDKTFSCKTAPEKESARDWRTCTS